jgi:DNA repair protein RecN (Recombination protein N)
LKTDVSVYFAALSAATGALVVLSTARQFLSQLRELGQLLIQIHGQHAHQLLVKSEHQKALLDGYAGEYALTQQMAEHYRQWHTSCRELAQHQQQSQERTARAELLHYQLKELNEFNPQPVNLNRFDEEYKRLANSGQLLSTSQHALNLLADGEDANLQSQLYTARQMVTELAGMDASLSGVLTMLEEAAIQVSEASDELRHYCDRLDLDPNRLYELEQRISKQISLARKHHVSPEALPQFHQALLEEQQQLDDQADSQETLSLRWRSTTNWHWTQPVSFIRSGYTTRTGTINHRQHAYAFDAARGI